MLLCDFEIANSAKRDLMIQIPFFFGLDDLNPL